jgi:hypothetical protein
MTSIQHLVEQIGASPWLNVASFVVGIVGFILAFVFYFRAKREKIPQYQIRTFRLIQDNVSKIPALKILYDNQPVENLTLTRISIWNRGIDPIESGDFAPSDKLRIEVEKSFKLLGAELWFAGKPTNNFSLSNNLEKKTVNIQFEYFGRNEGLVVSVFHTGMKDSDLKILGTLKGVESFSHFKKDGRLTDKLIGDPFIKFLGKIMPKKENGQIIVFILAIMMFSILAFLLLPLFALEKIIYLFQSPPKQFLIE